MFENQSEPAVWRVLCRAFDDCCMFALDRNRRSVRGIIMSVDLILRMNDCLLRMKYFEIQGNRRGIDIR
jgi:hypothetical protein